MPKSGIFPIHDKVICVIFEKCVKRQGMREKAQNAQGVDGSAKVRDSYMNCINFIIPRQYRPLSQR